MEAIFSERSLGITSPVIWEVMEAASPQNRCGQGNVEAGPGLCRVGLGDRTADEIGMMIHERLCGIE